MECLYCWEKTPYELDANGLHPTCDDCRVGLTLEAASLSVIVRQLRKSRAQGFREGVEEMKQLIGELVDALVWCSGSHDFTPSGQAGEAWARDVLPLLERAQKIAPKKLLDGKQVT